MSKQVIKARKPRPEHGIKKGDSYSMVPMRQAPKPKPAKRQTFGGSDTSAPKGANVP